MGKQFMKTLRLNMLELMNYSKIRKNKKKFSVDDIFFQLHSIYQLSGRKPNPTEIIDALEYLERRSLIEASPLGDVDVHSITNKGRDLLRKLSEGDETAVI
jgi:predicted transcriptional regulator